MNLIMEVRLQESLFFSSKSKQKKESQKKLLWGGGHKEFGKIFDR